MNWEDLWYEPGRWNRRLVGLVLAPVAWSFEIAVRLRNWAYDSGVVPRVRVPSATVVSVGNLIAGGAGKTPVTIFLARWAVACGRRVVVLTRGYGRRNREDWRMTSRELPGVADVGDEPRLIQRKCPAAEVWVGSRRWTLAPRAAESGFDFIILDDGFQHRRLERDVDILVEVSVPNEHLLPRGPFREPRAARERADFFWAQSDVPDLGENQIRAAASVVAFRSTTGERHRADWARGQLMVFISGIARAHRAKDCLNTLGVRLVDWHRFPDHHSYSKKELEAASERARTAGALLVTTEKDRERMPDDFDVWTMEFEVRVLSGLARLGAAAGLDPALAPVEEE
jgi:tetraacyldisaccharide 4'-kinase